MWMLWGYTEELPFYNNIRGLNKVVSQTCTWYDWILTCWIVNCDDWVIDRRVSYFLILSILLIHVNMCLAGRHTQECLGAVIDSVLRGCAHRWLGLERGEPCSAVVEPGSLACQACLQPLDLSFQPSLYFLMNPALQIRYVYYWLIGFTWNAMLLTLESVY